MPLPITRAMRFSKLVGAVVEGFSKLLGPVVGDGPAKVVSGRGAVTGWLPVNAVRKRSRLFCAKALDGSRVSASMMSRYALCKSPFCSRAQPRLA